MSEESPTQVPPAPDSSLPAKAGITFKSVLLALAAVILINAVAGFNEDVLKQGLMIGNFLPIAVYFVFFILVCIWNPLFSLVFKPLVFSKREAAAFFMLVLVGCWSPTSGLYRYFNRTIVSPVYMQPAKADWREHGTVKMLPEKLFPLKGNLEAPVQDNPDRAEGVIPASGDSVYSGFAQGLTITENEEDGAITQMFSSFHQMSEVLWAWAAPMKYWGTFLFFFVMTILSLSFIFHRQWSKHEQLSYPLANIASSVIERENGKIFGKIFHSKLFWGGFALPAVIHTINILHKWYTNEMPKIAVNWYVPWGKIFPVLNESGYFGVRNGAIYFCIVGVSYFVATEVSFTLGISSIILALIGAQFYMVTGTPLSSNDLNLASLGSYLAYGIMLAWAGRNYYWPVFYKAFTFSKAKESELDGVWAARFFVLFFVGMIFTMTVMGMDWLIAVLFAATHLLMFTIMTRIVCEAGTPFLQPFPGKPELAPMINKLFGSAFLGAKPMAFFGWLNVAIAADPRECLMPYAANALKVGEEFKLKLRRFFAVVAIFLCVGLAVGFIAKSYTAYKYGAQSDGYAWYTVGPRTIDSSTSIISYLNETGQREISDATSGLSKLKLISPDGKALGYFFIGMIAVFSLFLLRFRFAGFPIHPLLFIAWGSYGMQYTWFCYLLGCVIKMLIVKFGGGKVYQELKPIFLGLIVGELVVVGTSMVVGFIYFARTGLNPISHLILPG